MNLLRAFWRRLRAAPWFPWALDAVLLCLLAAWFVKPMFRMDYWQNWGSIESTFIADARFLNENWSHPYWQPLWYLGTRFDFIYPPALRYGTAWTARTFGVLPVRAYHLYVCLFFCLGIAGVYLFTRALSRSRWAAWGAALATLLVSPSFLLLKANRLDSLDWMPQRLWALMRYGEGPHITALALVPIALLFGYRALQKRRPLDFALCAAACALVVLNNFYGATALAVFFAVLVWSVFITSRDWRVLARAAGIAALVYGLTAFWLVPAYLRLSLRNMQYVAPPPTAVSKWVALAAVLVFLALSWRFARGRAERVYPVFLAGALFFWSLIVLGNAFFEFRVIGDPPRLIPELDLAIILAVAELFRWLWQRPWRWRKAVRAAIVVVSAAALATSYRYVRHPWKLYQPDPNYRQRVEYRMQDWIARHLPEARIFVAGSVRMWFDAWNSLAQPGGGSDQGLLNPLSAIPHWPIAMAEAPEPSVLWLKAIGADAIIVSDKTSQEEYHDYQFPRKFAGVLPVLYDDQQGNVIYGVPRRWRSLARVVERAQLAAFWPKSLVLDEGELRTYVDLLENGPDAPAEMRWLSTDAFRLRARVAEGQSLLVLVSHDRPWRAWSGDHEIPVQRDRLGFIRLDAPPGEHDIVAVFELPRGNLFGRLLSLLSVCVLVVWIAARRRSESGRWRPLSPAQFDALVVLALFALGFALNLPLFFDGESSYRGSIAGGYAAKARFVAADPNPWGWNPYSYCGLPMQFVYLPFVPYAAALVGWVLSLGPYLGYKLLVAVLTCLAPASVYLLARHFTGSRWWALAPALTYTLYSPLYGLISTLDKDRGWAQLPWRIQVLFKYGEGPHNVGLALTPLALLALWRAATGAGFLSIFIAAVLLAAVTLTNWISALALAFLCLLLLLAARGAPDVSRFSLRRALASAGLGYLLVCFWLTPTFIQTTVLNWRLDAYNYKVLVTQRLLLAGILAGALLLRLVLWRLRASFYPAFLTLGTFFFGWVAFIFYRWRWDTIPESHRYAIEFELLLMLAVFEWMRRAVRSRSRARMAVAGAALLVVLCADLRYAWKYWVQGWERWRVIPSEQTIEYKLANWLEDRQPRGRVLLSGGMRFRVATHADLFRVGGTFETGLQNRAPVHMAYWIRTGGASPPDRHTADSLLMLKALGVEYVVVHGEGSREFYRDYKNPSMFEGALEKVYAEAGDTIYRVPFRGYAHLIRPAEVPPWWPPDALRAYVAGIDDPQRPPLETLWTGTGSLEIRGPAPEGYGVALKVTYDPGWTATQDGAPVALAKDGLGFMQIRARPAAATRIVLRYHGTLEQKLAGGVSLLTWLACAAWLARGLRSRKGTSGSA